MAILKHAVCQGTAGQAGLFGLDISSASTAPPPVCSPAGPGFLAATAALSASPALGTKHSKNPAAFQETPKASKELFPLQPSHMSVAVLLACFGSWEENEN